MSVPLQVPTTESITTSLAVIAVAEKIEDEMMKMTTEMYNGGVPSLQQDDTLSAPKVFVPALEPNSMEVDDKNDLWEASMQELVSLSRGQSLICNAMEEDEDEMETDLQVDEADNEVWMQEDDDNVEMEETKNQPASSARMLESGPSGDSLVVLAKVIVNIDED